MASATRQADGKVGGTAAARAGAAPLREVRLNASALAAANINPATGLATDYLNHFNEAAMLIGLVPDMPEVLDDLKAWCPLGYVEHFERSGFAGRALAIAAYRSGDPLRRQRFEGAIARLDAEIGGAVVALEAAALHSLREVADWAAVRIAPLVAAASALIHGAEPEAERPGAVQTSMQTSVDALFA